MCVLDQQVSVVLQHRVNFQPCRRSTSPPGPMCHVVFILVWTISRCFCWQNCSQWCCSPFAIWNGWKPVFFENFSQAILLVFHLILVSVYSRFSVIPCLATSERILRAKTPVSIKTDLAQFHLISLSWSLIGRFFVIHSAFYWSKLPSKVHWWVCVL